MNRIAAAALAALLLTGCASSTKSEASSTDGVAHTPTLTMVPVSTPVPTPAPTVPAPASTPVLAPTAEPTPDPAQALRDAVDEMLTDGGVTWYPTVRDDVTGLWRLAVYASGTDSLPYLIDYWEAYAESEDEVHWIVNLTLGTTCRVTKVAGYIYAAYFEYTKGEEHSAKDLGSGTLLARYVIDPATGEAEDITSE